GWLLPNEVLVVVNSSAAAEIKRKADVSTTKTTNFTGDDLLGLFRKNGDDTVLIDVLGPFGNCDEAANWVVAGDKEASSKKTIVRDVIICGTTDWNESAGTDSLDSQWTVLGENIWTSLGRHGIGHNAEILRMSIGNIAATIDGTEATVSAEMPYGTDLTKLAVSCRLSQGAQMLINDSLAADTIDFSQPVLATVISCDSINQKVWTITVTMAPKPSSEANILTFNFVETTPISVSIDTANATIDAIVAFNLDSLKLTPVITIADKAKVSSTLLRSSKGIFTAKNRWDFNEPQTIAVTAEDLTVKNWTVSVTKEPEPSFTFSPLTDNSLKTNDIINLSWVSQNISQISFTIDIQDSSVQLTESAISADLGSWQYTIPDAMFGEGWVKAVRNGVVLDSIAVIISDTKMPMVVRQSPENGSSNMSNSLYISIVFDERITIAENANLKIGGLEFPITAVGDSTAKAFASGLDYSTLYTISVSDGAIKDLAGNSATLPTWTFTTRTAPQPDLYFSEYSKGSGSNKYYEIYNPCDTAVDLSRYFVTMNDFKSNETLPTLQLSGWLMPNEVLVVANSSATTAIKQNADISTTKTTTFTGDDILGLFRKDGSDTVLIDVLGPFGDCDAANYWSAAGVEKVSTDHTIVRKLITCGTTDWNESAGTDSLDSQWTVLGKDDWSNLGLHGNGHNVEILKMSIGGIAATIDRSEATVSVEVPYGTDLTKLAVAYRISQGAQMFINGSLAPDTIDFSQPVLATVISNDSINQKVWTITVTMAPKPSSDANILTFNFVETIPVSVAIDTANATIDAIVAFNLDSLKLTPVITISDKAKVSSTLFRSSKGIFTAKNRWDFDEPQTITVTAEDLTMKNWTVSVAKEPEPHLSFSPLATNSFGTGETINLSWTSYNISKISFTLDIQNNTIQLTDSAINADLGAWNFVVPDAVFGNGWVKAVRNGIAIDSIAVSIADTKAPMVVRQTPTNGSAEHTNSLYISMTFDEAITIAEDAKLKVGNTEALIVAVNDSMVKAFVSDLNFGTEYSVELPAGAIRDLTGNSATLPTWTFTTRTAPQPDLYFSEYAKGSSNNKYYEIYNPCDTAVDLDRYFVTMDAFSSNGSRSQATLQLSGWLMPNEVLVVANSSAATAIKQNADISTTKTTTFTGDDLLGLFRKNDADTVLIDVLGPFGECDAANYWSAAGVEKVSTDHTIVRNVIICGTTYWNESAGTDSLDSQWMVLGKDDWSDLGRHGIGHNADILKMSIGGIEANIYPAATGVLVEVPYGTDLTRLAVSYRISQGAQMFINDSLAADTVDLSQPVTATVIAGDSVNQKVWTIIVTMAPKPSSDNNILTFSFVEAAPISVTIDTANATIDAIMAYNLDSLKLTPVITIAEFASVSSTLFKSSKRVFTAKTKWNFNEPQTIKVTAEDLTEKVWSVRVDWEKSKELTIKDIAKLDGGLMANIGKPISTEGIVTHIVITSKGAEIHIQDSTGMWSGIMVFDEGNLYAANVAVGDRIKVSGVIAENFGMACIEQIEALAITSSDNRILTDTIIVEDALSTAYQNAIVTIDSVVCTGGFENLFAVSDSTNSILIYNKYRISDFALEIDSMYRITGIVYYTSADNSYRIIPRSADDIVKLVRPLKPEQTKPEEQKPEEQKPQEPDTTTVGIAGTTNIGLTAYTIGRTIVVENADATVTVFDIAGRLIATARPARRIAISAPHSGIYIIGTRQGAIKVRVD
ncbi:MAG: lamin tail domain-containing protein, partial [Salinivirgaceae bacterium]|nr:lamin tail domain-containing protein [Salinivirgaceae bacterium]